MTDKCAVPLGVAARGSVTMRLVPHAEIVEPGGWRVLLHGGI